MKAIALGFGLLMSAQAFGACYLPLGQIEGKQTSETTFSGTGEVYLRSSVLQDISGPVTAQVIAVNAEGLPSKIKYTLRSKVGTLTMIGTPNWGVYADDGVCKYSINIPVKVVGGKLRGKTASGSFNTVGVADSCTFKESYSIVSGKVCY
jgi:hypothetical protein